MKALLLGDVSPTNVTNPLFEKKRVKELFSDTVSLFEGNDVNFVNLECAVTNSKKEISKFGPCLKGHPHTIDVLQALGVNYCGISNNHVFDYGIQGALDTINFLEKAGIRHTGFGMNYHDSRRNLTIDVDGEKVCIIAVCEHEYSYALDDRMGCRPYDPYDTLEDIRQARKMCNRLIVIYHGGKEFCQYPSPRLHKLCHAMADNGADVILCQHSHCIGCYEKYRDCHIVYGQGNFHFVKPHTRECWNSSLAVKYDTKSTGITFIPLVSEEHGIAFTKGREKELILDAFEKRNTELLNGKWRDGWHKFCIENKELYLGIIGRAYMEHSSQLDNEHFGHFLDCEAHTDIWRELCPTANMTNEK